jgi:hypothetical protein
MRGIVTLLFVGAAACHGDPTSLRKDACTVVCRCVSPLPGEQAACDDACVDGQLLPDDLSDDCVDAVFRNEASCGALIAAFPTACSRPPTNGGEDDQP